MATDGLTLPDRRRAVPTKLPLVMVHADAGMGGPARTMAALAAYLAPRNQVVVATPNGFISDSVSHLDVELVLLEKPRTGCIKRMARMQRLLQIGARLHARSIFHANGISALNIAAPAALRADVPAVVHFHSSELSARATTLLKTWRRLGLRVWFAPVSRVAEELLACHGLSDRIVGRLGNPVAPGRHRDGLRTTRRPFRVGWLGSAKPVKGLHRVADIMKLTEDLPLEWRMYGVGDHGFKKPYLAEAFARIQGSGLAGRVTWCGWATDPDVAYQQVDALLITSSRESFCRVAVEAMAADVPVVASRIPAITELIHDGDNGLIYGLDEPRQAARAIRLLVTERALRDSIVDKGRMTAARFIPENVGRMAETIYAHVLRNEGL